jgi:hypothetical protein
MIYNIVRKLPTLVGISVLLKSILLTIVTLMIEDPTYVDTNAMSKIRLGIDATL